MLIVNVYTFIVSQTHRDVYRKIRVSLFWRMAPCELKMPASYYICRLPEYGSSDVVTCQCTWAYNLKKKTVDSQELQRADPS